MRQPQEIPDEEHERVLERVAAVDVAKASGMVCIRVPHPDRAGKRRALVWRCPRLPMRCWSWVSTWLRS